MPRSYASARTIARPVYRSSSFVPYRRRRPYLPVSVERWENYSHTFPGSSLDTTFWISSFGDAATISGNKATFPSATVTYSGIASKAHSLIGSYVLIQLDPRPTGGYAGITIKSNDGGNTDIFAMSYRHTAGQLWGDYNGSDWGGADTQTTTAFSGSTVWFRIRESGGTIYGDYSTDASSWTNLHSATGSASALNALRSCRVQLDCGPFSSSMTTGPSFANLNNPVSSTTITHTSPTATITVSGNTAPDALTVTHTSPTAILTVAGNTSPTALTVAHTSPTAILTVAGDTAPVALTLTHTSPTADITVSGDTNNGGAITITHTSPTVTVTVSGNTAPGDLTVTHTSPTAAVTVAAGLTNTLSVTHTSPTATLTVSGDTAPTALTLTHTSPTATLTVSGSTAPGALTLTHSSPTATLTVAAGLQLGDVTVSGLVADKPLQRAYSALGVTSALTAETPVRSYEAIGPSLTLS